MGFAKQYDSYIANVSSGSCLNGNYFVPKSANSVFIEIMKDICLKMVIYLHGHVFISLTLFEYLGVVSLQSCLEIF